MKKTIETVLTHIQISLSPPHIHKTFSRTGKKEKIMQKKTRKRKCRSLRTSESNLLSHFDEHKKRVKEKGETRGDEMGRGVAMRCGTARNQSALWDTQFQRLNPAHYIKWPKRLYRAVLILFIIIQLSFCCRCCCCCSCWAAAYLLTSSSLSHNKITWARTQLGLHNFLSSLGQPKNFRYNNKNFMPAKAQQTREHLLFFFIPSLFLFPYISFCLTSEVAIDIWVVLAKNHITYEYLAWQCQCFIYHMWCTWRNLMATLTLTTTATIS